jgi:hypothetical protein
MPTDACQFFYECKACVRNPEIAALFQRVRKMPADAIGPNPVEKPNPGKQSQN